MAWQMASACVPERPDRTRNALGTFWDDLGAPRAAPERSWATPGALRARRPGAPRRLPHQSADLWSGVLDLVQGGRFTLSPTPLPPTLGQPMCEKRRKIQCFRVKNVYFLGPGGGVAPTPLAPKPRKNHGLGRPWCPKPDENHGVGRRVAKNLAKTTVSATKWAAAKCLYIGRNGVRQGGG